VLEPALWNVFYDDLLRLPMPEGINLIGFADDIVIVATAAIPIQLKEALEEAYALVNNWISTHRLQIAAEKTEALFFTSKRKHNIITVNCTS